MHPKSKIAVLACTVHKFTSRKCEKGRFRTAPGGAIGVPMGPRGPLGILGLPCGAPQGFRRPNFGSWNAFFHLKTRSDPKWLLNVSYTQQSNYLFPPVRNIILFWVMWVVSDRPSAHLISESAMSVLFAHGGRPKAAFQCWYLCYSGLAGMMNSPLPRIKKVITFFLLCVM